MRTSPPRREQRLRHIYGTRETAQLVLKRFRGRWREVRAQERQRRTDAERGDVGTAFRVRKSPVVKPGPRQKREPMRRHGFGPMRKGQRPNVDGRRHLHRPVDDAIRAWRQREGMPPGTAGWSQEPEQ